jgi:hypothetical protein
LRRVGLSRTGGACSGYAVKGTDNAVKGTDNAVKGTDNAVKGTNNAVKGTNNAMQGMDNAVKGTDNSMKGTDLRRVSQPRTGGACSSVRGAAYSNRSGRLSRCPPVTGY